MIGVDIHILNTDTLEGEEEKILPLIAPSYAAKYERMRIHSGKMQELGAGYLLNKVLGVSKDDQLVIGEFGKPGLSREFIEDGLFKEFSLSHADNFVILAVSSESVGVDIERCDRLTLPVLKRVLPVNYYAKLVETEGTEKYMDEKSPVPVETRQEWAKAWTSIEAVLKAVGSGFSIDPREKADFMDNWHVESFLLENDFMVSCACQEQIQLRKIML